LAVIIFNKQFLPVLEIMTVMGTIIEQQAKIYINFWNDTRIAVALE